MTLDELQILNHVPELIAVARVQAIEVALAEVEKPAPIPVGSPGSAMRRAWDLGRRLSAGRQLTRTLCAYVAQYGLEHEDDCPEDSTCECELTLALSNALDNAARGEVKR